MGFYEELIVAGLVVVGLGINNQLDLHGGLPLLRLPMMMRTRVSMTQSRMGRMYAIGCSSEKEKTQVKLTWNPTALL